MKSSPKNRSSHQGAPKERKTTQLDANVPQGDAPGEAVINVQCPNPACRRTWTIRKSCAGKMGRCQCGTVFPVPDHGAAPSAEENPPEGAPAEVRVGCIGRGHAGKTALLRALGEGPVGDFFPSGLHVDAGDPREVARMIREADETNRLLHQVGLPPTLEASQIRYFLYDGAEQRVAYQIREVIGQVLTHTLPNSAADQQARYTEYLRTLVNTHVLWAVVPCLPANASARDQRRYANDLRITLAYLREALRLRSLERPAAVALVLSKIDTLFADADEARSSLTDEVLRASFGPLVHLVEQSSQVADAAIIPVTTFGFGNAILREEGGREGAPPAEDDPFASEPIWLLREGVPAQPHNLDTLFLWTVFFGLLGREGHGILEEDSELGRIARTLAQDMDAIDAWQLPIKEGIAQAGQHTGTAR